jgi:hypothetical protein
MITVSDEGNKQHANKDMEDWPSKQFLIAKQNKQNKTTLRK